MANVGKIFEKELKKFLERENLLVIHQVDVLGKRFTIRKEFDFVVCNSDRLFFAIEAKATRADVFSFANIKEHQRENLTVVDNTQYGRGYLALNMRGRRSPGNAWLIPWGFWASWEKLWRGRKKSIRLDEAIVQFRMFALERVTGGWEIK